MLYPRVSPQIPHAAAQHLPWASQHQKDQAAFGVELPPLRLVLGLTHLQMPAAKRLVLVLGQATPAAKRC